MDGRAGDQARAAVEVLADLSSAASSDRPSLSIPLEWFRWLPMCERLFVPLPQVPSLSTVLGDLAGPGDRPSVAVEREFGERLIGVDQVRAKAHTVRVGWLFVAGRLVDGDRRRRVFHPLVTVPVRVGRPLLTGSAFIVAAGDAELSPLITGDVRHRLEAGLQVDRRRCPAPRRASTRAVRQAAPAGRSTVSAARDERDRALAARDDVHHAIVDQLDAEIAWTRATEAHDEAWSVAPGLLDPDVDLVTVDELLRRGLTPAAGWWSRRLRRRAWAELIRLARA